MIRVRFKKKKICPAMLQMDVTKNKLSRYVCDKSIHEQDKAICTCLLVSIIIKKKVIKQDSDQIRNNVCKEEQRIGRAK